MTIRRILAVAAIAAMCAAAPAYATVLAQWTYETNTPGDQTDAAASNIVAGEGGVFAGSSNARGVHAGAASDWTTPAGNGTANSHSVNTWAVGDYWEFRTPTTGYQNITIGWDQTSSNTGPRDFNLQWSVNGTTFTTLTSYMVLANGTPNPAWNSTTHQPAYVFAPAAGPAALNNQPLIYWRLTQNSTVSANGGVVAAAGTDRVDNIIIEGTLVPEPASLALLACGALAMVRRRR